MFGVVALLIFCYQAAMARIGALLDDTRALIMTHNQHWPMGLMLSLSVIVAISFGNADIPPFVSVGAIAGFIVAAIIYAQDNVKKMASFCLPTACILFVFLLIFHGPGLRALDLLVWSPMFINIVLLSTVNIAPPLAEGLHKIGRVLSGLTAMVDSAPRSREVQDIDLEEGLLDNMLEAEDAARPARPARAEGVLFATNHMDHDRATVRPPPVEGDIELDGRSVSTTPTVRNLMLVISGPVGQTTANEHHSPLSGEDDSRDI